MYVNFKLYKAYTKVFFNSFYRRFKSIKNLIIIHKSMKVFMIY